MTPRRRRGSAVVAVLILAIVLLAAVGLFLRMASSEVLRADSAAIHSALLNAADAGTQEALWALQTGDWEGWVEREGFRWREIGGLGRALGRELGVSALVSGNRSMPTIWVEARYESSAGKVFRKQTRTVARAASPFRYAVAVQEDLRFAGQNVGISAYDSKQGPPDAFFNRVDRAVVAVGSGPGESVNLQNARIFGFLITAGSRPTVGPQGRLHGADTPAHLGIDPDRVFFEILPHFPVLDPPPGTRVLRELPPGRHIRLGDPDGFQVWRYELPSLRVRPADTLVVEGPTIIVVSGEADIQGRVSLEGAGRLSLFVSGDLSLSGPGVVNPEGDPTRVAIYGTAGESQGQQWRLSGQGALQGTLYAPNATLDLRGGGQTGFLHGAVVARAVVFSGNYELHYDINLARHPGVAEGYNIYRWEELQDPATRIDFPGVFSGGELPLPPY